MSDANFVLTPQGYRRRELFNIVKGGTHVRRAASSWKTLSVTGEVLHETFSASEVSPVGKPPETGWVSYAETQNTSGNPITRFETTWTVPPAPKTTSGQLIYLFNGLQDLPVTHILQPVLQWGSSLSPDSGNFWAVASWWVGQQTDQFFTTELVRVNVGDVLVGRMTMNSSTQHGYAYTSEFVGIHGSKLTAENLPELTDCTETLEAYGITSDADYPDSPYTGFTKISLQTGNVTPALSWSPKGPFPPKIVSNSTSDGAVQIFYPRNEAVAKS